MIEKQISYLSAAVIAVSLAACGSSEAPSSPIPPKTLPKETIAYVAKTIPLDIALDIPQVLKNDRSTKQTTSIKAVRVGSGSPSMGYTLMKNDIQMAEDAIANTKLDLYFADSIMSKVISTCKDTPINETCDIPSNTIEYKLSKEIIKGAVALKSKTDTQEAKLMETALKQDIDKVIPVGAIAYTVYDTNQTFQHALKIDMSINAREKEQNAIKWSDDKKRIQTQIFLDDGIIKTDMQIAYIKEQNGSEKMTMIDKFEDSELSGEFTLSFDKKADANQTILVNLKNKMNGFSTSSHAKLSNTGGYMATNGEDPEGAFGEKEYFDTNGTQTASLFCFAGAECNVSDEKTWIKVGAELFPLPVDINLTVGSHSITIGSGTLNDGEYELIPKTANIPQKLDFLDVLDASKGILVVQNNTITNWFLENEEDILKLDSFTLVHDTMQRDANDRVIYEVLTVQQTPTFIVN